MKSDPSQKPRDGATDAMDGERRVRTDVYQMHASAIAIGASGVLIAGPSGRGKSSLALRALARAPNAFLSDAVTLIADDQVMIEKTGNVLRAMAPATIAGKLEVRGVGIVSVPFTPDGAPIRMIVRIADAASIERLPLAPQFEDLLGQPVPAVNIDPADPAAIEKILMALRELDDGMGGRSAET